jgi:hypothetical protein
MKQIDFKVDVLFEDMVLSDDELFLVRGGGFGCGTNCGNVCGNSCGDRCGNTCSGGSAA